MLMAGGFVKVDSQINARHETSPILLLIRCVLLMFTYGASEDALSIQAPICLHRHRRPARGVNAQIDSLLSANCFGPIDNGFWRSKLTKFPHSLDLSDLQSTLHALVPLALRQSLTLPEHEPIIPRLLTSTTSSAVLDRTTAISHNTPDRLALNILIDARHPAAKSVSLVPPLHSCEGISLTCQLHSQAPEPRCTPPHAPSTSPPLHQTLPCGHTHSHSRIPTYLR